MIRSVCVLCALLVLTPCILFAQDNGFFEEGFVEGLGEGSKDAEQPSVVAPKKKRQIEQSAPSIQKDTQEEEFKDFFGNATSPDSAHSKKDDSILESGTYADEVAGGIKINGVALILTTSDQGKVSRAIKSYLGLVKQTGVEPVRLYVVNNGSDPLPGLRFVASEMQKGLQIVPDAPRSLEEVKALAPEEVKRLMHETQNSPLFPKYFQMASSITNVFSIPKDIPVKSLPSWMLYTEKGRIVLEGIVDPSSMITKSGKFIAPMGIESK